MGTPAGSIESASDAVFDREASYRRYLEALLDGDRNHCRACFELWLAHTPDLRVVYEDLVQRALYAVGELWERGKISVAREHLATAISESLLHLSYPRLFAVRRSGKAAVVAAIANDLHQLGTRMVADMLELHGWRTHCLGANTPLPDLLGFIGQVDADLVALSSTVSANVWVLLHAADAIRAEFPGVPIIVGGQAFQRGGKELVERIAGVHCLTTLMELESWLTTTHAHAGTS